MPAPQPNQGQADTAGAVVEANREALRTVKASGQSWTQSYQQHQTARRVTEKVKKNQLSNAAGPRKVARSVG